MIEFFIIKKCDIKELETDLRYENKELEISFKRDMKDLEMRLPVRIGAMIAAGIVVVTALVKLL